MTGLNWIRLDTGLPMHDKTLRLLGDPSPKRWQAMTSYVFGLAWSGNAGTDGFIPTNALPMIHSNATAARLLVAHGFWEEATVGWRVPNWADRQPLAATAEAEREARRLASRKGNCVRHHGLNCGCWMREKK